jgi:hypothetical protein
MVDDEVFDLPRSGEPTGDAADRTVFVSAPVAFVRRLATSERGAIRVCSTEIRFSSDDRAVMTELLTRIDEELRWSAPTSVTP